MKSELASDWKFCKLIQLIFFLTLSRHRSQKVSTVCMWFGTIMPQHNPFSQDKPRTIQQERFFLTKLITKVLFLGMKEFDKDLMTVNRYFKTTWDTNTITLQSCQRISLWSISHYRFHALFSFPLIPPSCCVEKKCIESSEKDSRNNLIFSIYTLHIFRYIHFVFTRFYSSLTLSLP